MTASSTISNLQGQLPVESLQDKTQRYPYENISKLESEHFWFLVRNERICDLVKLSLPDYAQASFLEIGSGTGNVLGFLEANGFQNLTGFEIDEAGLEISKSRFPGIRFENRNILNDEIVREKFDAVGLFDCIEHFADDRLPLENARKYLKKGGKLYITVPAHDFLWSEIDELFGHYCRYTKKSLESSLQKAGFKLQKQFYFMAPLVPFAVVHRKFKKYPVPSSMSEAEIDALLQRETSKPHDLINSMMLHLARLEHKVLRTSDLGFGGSILAVASVEI